MVGGSLVVLEGSVGVVGSDKRLSVPNVSCPELTLFLYKIEPT